MGGTTGGGKEGGRQHGGFGGKAGGGGRVREEREKVRAATSVGSKRETQKAAACCHRLGVRAGTTTTRANLMSPWHDRVQGTPSVNVAILEVVEPVVDFIRDLQNRFWSSVISGSCCSVVSETSLEELRIAAEFLKHKERFVAMGIKPNQP